MTDEMPHAEESEKLLLGTILFTPSMLEKVRESELAPERFHSPTNRKVYAAILSLDEKSVEINSVTVHKALNGSVEMSYLTGLQTGLPAFNDPKPYIDEIISTSRKRWIIHLAEKVDGMARNGQTEDETLEYVANQVESARQKLPHGKHKPQLMADLVDDQAERYMKWHKGISNALPTGFPEIDDHLLGGGLVKSGLYVLAAHTSMGKTSLALDITANVAGAGKTVYMVSREMPAPQLFDRLHSAYTGIARWKLRPGIYAQEYSHLIGTLPEMGTLPVILDNYSGSVVDLRDCLRDFARKRIRPDLVVVDQIQLLDGQGRTRNESVGSVTRGLKILAMELDVPILALSQLSRDSDKARREPELMDLRDSGEIEQDADAVFFLFGDRPEEGAKFFSRWFKCSKQRDGELFRKELSFNGELVTFRSSEQLAKRISA